MDKTGIPPDINWRGIANVILTADSENKFTEEQKRSVREALNAIIKRQDFSQDSYRNLQETINAVAYYQYLETQQELSLQLENAKMTTKTVKDLFNNLLHDFSAFIEQVEQKTGSRQDDVEEMKDTTVTAIRTIDDKTEIIHRVKKAASKVVGNIQAEMAYLREKALAVDTWKQKALNLAKIATIDKLTGLYNLRAFEDYLSLILSSETDPTIPISLLLVDIDNFKEINDTYGHLVGDQVLKLIASIMKQNAIREDDFVVRHGGDELGIVCFKLKVKEASKLAEKIRGDICAYKFLVTSKDNIIEDHPNTPQVTVSITVSIGVAGGAIGDFRDANTSQHSSRSRALLLKAADQQLYKAKQNGRNQVCEYDFASAASS